MIEREGVCRKNIEREKAEGSFNYLSLEKSDFGAKLEVYERNEQMCSNDYGIRKSLTFSNPIVSTYSAQIFTIVFVFQMMKKLLTFDPLQLRGRPVMTSRNFL